MIAGRASAARYGRRMLKGITGLGFRVLHFKGSVKGCITVLSSSPRYPTFDISAQVEVGLFPFPQGLTSV